MEDGANDDERVSTTQAAFAGPLVWPTGSWPMTTNLTTYSALIMSCTACLGEVGTTSSIERIESPCGGE